MTEINLKINEAQLFQHLKDYAILVGRKWKGNKYLGDLMEKSRESGQFLVLSFLLHREQQSRKLWKETGFQEATLTKYISLINECLGKEVWRLTIHLEDENLRLSVGTA